MARDADNALSTHIAYSIARVRLACRVGKAVASCAGTAKEPEHHTAARVEGKLYLGESNEFSLATGFEGGVDLGMMFHFYLVSGCRVLGFAGSRLRAAGVCHRHPCRHAESALVGVISVEFGEIADWENLRVLADALCHMGSVTLFANHAVADSGVSNG